jgi:hypothetical protein
MVHYAYLGKLINSIKLLYELKYSHVDDIDAEMHDR